MTQFILKKFLNSIIILLVISILMVSCKKENPLPDPLAAGWKNKSVCELIKDNEELRVLRCTFAPGVGHEKHYHEPHFGYTIAGSKFRIKDEKGIKEVNVGTGSHFYSKGTDWHEVLNIGDSTAIFLIIEPK